MVYRLFQILVIAFCSAWLLKEIAVPVTVALYYGSEFQRLTVACDTAMDDSWYQSEKGLGKSEKVQLMACHEYDKVRKIMLVSGVPEDYLSYLGLKSLEIYQRPAEEFVEQHRFRER